MRHDVAMTGEVTLRGRVLAIGGLREKTMAAYRAGIKTVLFPAENTADLVEVDPVVKEAVTFVPVSSVDEVLPRALTEKPGRKTRAHAPVPPAGNGRPVIPASAANRTVQE